MFQNVTVTATLTSGAWPATVAGGVDGDVESDDGDVGGVLRVWGVHAGVAGESDDHSGDVYGGGGDGADGGGGVWSDGGHRTWSIRPVR